MIRADEVSGLTDFCLSKTWVGLHAPIIHLYKTSLMKLLIVKNGVCDTDIEILIYKVDHNIETRIVCSRSKELESIDTDKFDGIIILGGPQRLSDPQWRREYRYLAKFVRIIQNWIRDGVNILGICLGAQLIALALGHNILERDEIVSGYNQNITLTPSGINDPVFDYDFEIFKDYYLSLHADYIAQVEIGRQLDVLAMSDDMIYAFRYGNVIGVQFHPDITLRILEKFCSEFNFESQLVEESQRIRNCAEMANMILFMHWINSLKIRSMVLKIE